MKSEIGTQRDGDKTIDRERKKMRDIKREKERECQKIYRERDREERQRSKGEIEIEREGGRQRERDCPVNCKTYLSKEERMMSYKIVEAP